MLLITCNQIDQKSINIFNATTSRPFDFEPFGTLLSIIYFHYSLCQFLKFLLMYVKVIRNRKREMIAAKLPSYEDSQRPEKNVCSYILWQF